MEVNFSMLTGAIHTEVHQKARERESLPLGADCSVGRCHVKILIT